MIVLMLITAYHEIALTTVGTNFGASSQGASNQVASPNIPLVCGRAETTKKNLRVIIAHIARYFDADFNTHVVSTL